MLRNISMILQSEILSTETSSDFLNFFSHAILLSFKCHLGARVCEMYSARVD